MVGADLPPLTRCSAQPLGTVFLVAESNIQFAIGGMARTTGLFMPHKWTKTLALMGESLQGR